MLRYLKQLLEPVPPNAPPGSAILKVILIVFVLFVIIGIAIIAVAIGFGVLIFIVSSPASGVTCTSSITTIPLEFYTITVSPQSSEIRLQNATGDIMGSFWAAAASGNFAIGSMKITGNGAGIGDSSIAAGGTIIITPAYSTSLASGQQFFGTYTFGYLNQLSQEKQFTITCQGPLA